MVSSGYYNIYNPLLHFLLNVQCEKGYNLIWPAGNYWYGAQHSVGHGIMRMRSTSWWGSAIVPILVCRTHCGAHGTLLREYHAGNSIRCRGCFLGPLGHVIHCLFKSCQNSHIITTPPPAWTVAMLLRPNSESAWEIHHCRWLFPHNFPLSWVEFHAVFCCCVFDMHSKIRSWSAHSCQPHRRTVKLTTFAHFVKSCQVSVIVISTTYRLYREKRNNVSPGPCEDSLKFLCCFLRGTVLCKFLPKKLFEMQSYESTCASACARPNCTRYNFPICSNNCSFASLIFIPPFLYSNFTSLSPSPSFYIAHFRALFCALQLKWWRCCCQVCCESLM